MLAISLRFVGDKGASERVTGMVLPSFSVCSSLTRTKDFNRSGTEATVAEHRGSVSVSDSCNASVGIWSKTAVEFVVPSGASTISLDFGRFSRSSPSLTSICELTESPDIDDREEPRFCNSIVKPLEEDESLDANELPSPFRLSFLFAPCR